MDLKIKIRERKPVPGQTRFWCSCDPQQPFSSSADLIAHVMACRASGHALCAAPGNDAR